MGHRKNPVTGWDAPFGLMMGCHQAAKQLRRAGVISRKDQRLFKEWTKAGFQQPQDGSRLDWIVWSVWMWQLGVPTMSEN